MLRYCYLHQAGHFILVCTDYSLSIIPSFHTLYYHAAISSGKSCTELTSISFCICAKIFNGSTLSVGGFSGLLVLGARWGLVLSVVGLGKVVPRCWSCSFSWPPPCHGHTAVFCCCAIRGTSGWWQGWCKEMMLMHLQAKMTIFSLPNSGNAQFFLN